MAALTLPLHVNLYCTKYMSACHQHKQLCNVICASTQNSQAVKKGVALCKKARMKKLQNIGGNQETAVMVGQLIMTIQVNFPASFTSNRHIGQGEKSW